MLRDGRETRAEALVDFAATWLTGDDLIGFELASGEALANCVEHGGGPTLLVECWRDRGRLTAEIRHQGRGFDPPKSVNAPPISTE
ncbi:MAG TPA: ATP-binding protein [Candidatus Cybelea sp.]